VTNLYCTSASQHCKRFSTVDGGGARVQVFDLLDRRKELQVREDGKKKKNIVGLRECHVRDEGTVAALITHSAENRQTGVTGANAESSRSHSIMQFSLKRLQADESLKEACLLPSLQSIASCCCCVA
jgi:kinesin family member 2/24